MFSAIENVKNGAKSLRQAAAEYTKDDFKSSPLKPQRWKATTP